jgi:DNA-3-methyladenine glycosylase I
MEKRCRCAWVDERSALYCAYHDAEWGTPLHDERAMYELFLLEAFQAGLSWITILKKRENFRAAFDGFDVEKNRRVRRNKNPVASAGQRDHPLPR